MSTPRIHFSDFFGIPPELVHEHGAFNISLVNDLPLFIDPFLLFHSSKPEYGALHDGIIDYVRFLKAIAASGAVSRGSVHEWFRFPEVQQNWLGYSKTGNKGRGLGNDFASALIRNLQHVFRDFGEETITGGSHLEKLCLIKSGVGRDMMSDFVTNLVKDYLLQYTQRFAKEHLPSTCVSDFAVTHVRFNYDTTAWETDTFTLPTHEGDYVILTPKDILTKDSTWINRPDMLDSFYTVADSIPNEQLRHRIDTYLRSALPAEPEADEVKRAIARVIEENPEFLDYYIRRKEEMGDRAELACWEQVQEVNSRFVTQLRGLAAELRTATDFYEIGFSTYDECMRRVLFLKDVIENKGGQKFFYVNDEPIRREQDLHLMYRLTWFAPVSDVTREANDGRGPVDFKVSQGSIDKTLVEFKLARNTKLERNLKNQLGVYQRASDAPGAISVIVYFSEQERERVAKILDGLQLAQSPHIILIDASADNKPSGSKA